MTVPNVWLAEQRDKVFANTSAYNVELPMAGRQQETQTLTDALTASGRRIVTLSADLGTGKTFFLSRVLRDLSKAGVIDEGRQVHLIAANDERNWDSGFADVAAGETRILQVEELDRKLRYPQLTAALDHVFAWFAEQDDAVLLLTGDRFIRHDLITAGVAAADAEHWDLSLDPLSRPLLAEAIAKRIDKVRGTLTEGVSDEAVETADALLRDDSVAAVVLPPTAPSSATFRESLGRLQSLAGVIPLLADRCEFDASSLQRLAEPSSLTDPLQKELEQAVLVALTADVADGRALEPMTVEKLLELVPRTAGDDEDYVAEDYELDVVQPLAQTGHLLPLGVPYSQGTTSDDRLAGPYLPTSKVFLSAILRQPGGAGA